MRDKIIALARESGFNDPDCRSNLWLASLERFYQLAVADAERRIMELDMEVMQKVCAHDVAFAQAMNNGQRASEAERKLDVAREALKSAYNTATDHDDREPFDWAVYCEMLYQTLAQIGEK